MDLSEFGENEKTKVQEDEKYIEKMNSKNEYKKAIEKAKILKEYISTVKCEIEKRKEEEKKQAEQKQAANIEESNKDSSEGKPKTSNNTNSTEDYVSKLNVASQTDQLVIVKGQGGGNAIVEFHMKDSSGAWKQVFSVDSYVGSNGISYNKSEGDRRTPAGVFSFGTAFGIADNPGCNISYRKVTSDDYWVDDPNSKYYNQWVSGNVSDRDWNSAEHLIDHGEVYKYSIVINYNTVKGKGSAIFLHCKTYPTPGCVSIPESYMIKLLRNINSSTLIVIAPSANDVYNF